MKTRLWSQPRGVHLRRRRCCGRSPCCGRSREDMKECEKTKGGCCGRSPLSTQNLMTWRRLVLRATRLPFEGLYIPHFRVDFGGEEHWKKHKNKRRIEEISRSRTYSFIFFFFLLYSCDYYGLFWWLCWILLQYVRLSLFWLGIDNSNMN